MAEQQSLRVYVIGRLDKELESQPLTTIAEYRTARGLSRILIHKADLDNLVTQIGLLKSYIEGGAPPFARDALKALGSQLFEILFVGKTRNLFFKVAGAREHAGLLPLEIIAEDPEVAGWPWEYLYDPHAETFISREFYPISRSIFTANKPADRNEIEGKVQMLLVLGVPPDDSGTTPKEEIQHIRDVFSAVLDAGRFDIDILNAEDYKKIAKKLATKKFDIVHYFGHAGFDAVNRVGYLNIKRPGKAGFKIDADDFAILLADRGIRLVFLNACKSAVNDPTSNPARSSIAAALLDRGIPAVVASQFSLPDNSAHYLAATIYNTLLTKRSISHAMRDGRNAIKFADEAKFFDWGIPVLYSMNPDQVVLPIAGGEPAWADDRDETMENEALARSLAGGNPMPGAPSVVAERTRSSRRDAKFKVALIDIDAKVGFLPDLAEAANKKQKYYHFEVVYLPVPSGYARDDLGADVQTYLPRLAPALASTPDLLAVDFVCALTCNGVAIDQGNEISYRLFAASLPGNDNVIVISTFKVREYAREAHVPFAKAVLMMCLSVLVEGDERWPIKRHPETVGCLFDRCEIRSDIVVGLRKMRFDHEQCRGKIGDTEQLAAIDALTRLEIT